MTKIARPPLHNGAIAILTADEDVSALDRFALAASPEWRSVCARQHNLLLEGPQLSTDTAVDRLRPYLRSPATCKPAGAPLEIPVGKGGALVIEGIASLTGPEQTRLLEWLNESGDERQVVSTTTEPLFPLVARGLFDETLYYRLSVVLLRAEASGAIPL